MSEIICIKCKKKFKSNSKLMATVYCSECGKENPNPNIKKKILLLSLFLLMLPITWGYLLGDYDGNGLIESPDMAECYSHMWDWRTAMCVCDSQPCMCLDLETYQDRNLTAIDCQAISEMIMGHIKPIWVNKSEQKCLVNISTNNTFNIFFYPETNTLVWGNYSFTITDNNNLTITNYNNNNITSIFYNNISLAIYNNNSNSILIYHNLTLINYFNNSYLITNNHNLTLFIDNKNNVTVFNTNQNNINVTVYNSQNINSFFFQNSTYLFNNTYYNNWYVNNNYNNTWYNNFNNWFNNLFNFTDYSNINITEICQSEYNLTNIVYVNQSQSQSHTVYVNVSNNNSCSYTDESEVKVNVTNVCPSIPSCPSLTCPTINPTTTINNTLDFNGIISYLDSHSLSKDDEKNICLIIGVIFIIGAILIAWRKGWFKSNKIKADKKVTSNNKEYDDIQVIK